MRPAAIRSALLALLALLAGCGQAPTQDPRPSDPTDATLELEGVWRFSFETEDPASPQVRALEFGAATSGEAREFRHDPRSNVVRCDARPYALLVDGGLLLDGVAYDVERRGEDELELTRPVADGTVRITLERLDALPFEPCRPVATELFAPLYTSVHQDSKLNAGTDGGLYLTLDRNDDAVARFSMATQALEEEYPDPYHSVIVGARDANLAFGSCFCGHSRTLEAYDLATGAVVASVDELAHPGDGAVVRIRAGYYDARAGELILAVRAADSDANHLFTMIPQDDSDPATVDAIAVEATRAILEGADVRDLAVVDGELLALADGQLVRVGEDGRATETLSLEGVGGSLRGIASVGSVLYVLGETNERGFVRAALLP